MDRTFDSRMRRDSLYNSLTFAASATRGKRDHMEDFYTTIPFGHEQNKTPLNAPLTRRSSVTEFSMKPSASSEGRPITFYEETPNHAFFAVYDGHGGNQAADFMHKILHQRIVSHPQFKTDTVQAMRETFLMAEKELEEFFTKENIHGGVGTTACVCVIYNHTLYVANVGDSAAILCRKGEPVQLTNPHSPYNPNECQRVQNAGGLISNNRLGHPVWNPKLINLGVTRAFGDFYFKQQQYTQGKPSGLIADPEIVSLPITTDDIFLLLASDGFWDVIGQKEAVNYIMNRSHFEQPDVIASELVKLAELHSTRDNTTVVLVRLRELQTEQA